MSRPEPAAAGTLASSVLAERAPAVAAALAQLPQDIVASAPAVLAASDFLLDALCRDPDLIAALGSRAGQRVLPRDGSESARAGDVRLPSRIVRVLAMR